MSEHNLQTVQTYFCSHVVAWGYHIRLYIYHFATESCCDKLYVSWGGCYGKSSNVAVYSRTTLSTPVCFSNSKFKDNRIIQDIKSNRNNPSEARLKRVFILFHERKKWIRHIECISHPYAAVLPLCASWTQSSKPEVERKGMLVTLVAPYLPRRIIYLAGLSTSPDYPSLSKPIWVRFCRTGKIPVLFLIYV